VVVGLFLATYLIPSTHPLAGQEGEGSTSAAVGTAALGFYSGSALGLTGSLIPCSQRLAGVRCSRIALSAGGILGATAGAIIGANDLDRAQDHARGAGIGALVGAVSGVVLKRVVRQYGWADAGAVALIGGAVGASPEGAGIGVAAGSVAGGLLWYLIPSFDVADAVSLSLGGMALGALGGWAYSASQAAEGGGGPQFILPLTFTF